MRAPSGPSRVTPSTGRGAPGPGREPRAPRFSTCKTGLRRVLKASTCCDAEKSGHAKCSGPWQSARQLMVTGRGRGEAPGAEGQRPSRRGPHRGPHRGELCSSPANVTAAPATACCLQGMLDLARGPERSRPGPPRRVTANCSARIGPCPPWELRGSRFATGAAAPGVHTRTRTVPYPRGSGLGNSLPKPWIVTSCNSRNPGDDIF